MELNITHLKRADQLKNKLIELVGEKGLIQLAKDGTCPHYILVNPITNENNYYFLATELNEWFVKNYASRIDSTFSSKIDFVFFNKEDHKIKTYHEVPTELCKIKNLFELPIENIKSPSGIYFLCKNSVIQYIGQAVSINNRVGNHLKDGLKDFNKVFFITCPEANLFSLETALIRYFKPPLNISSTKNSPTNSEMNILIELLDIKNETN